MKECIDSWFRRENRISSLPERDDPRCRWRVGSRAKSLENEDCSLGEEEEVDIFRWFILSRHRFF